MTTSVPHWLYAHDDLFDVLSQKRVTQLLSENDADYPKVSMKITQTDAEGNETEVETAEGLIFVHLPCSLPRVLHGMPLVGK